MNPIFGVLLILGLSVGIYSGTISKSDQIVAKSELNVELENEDKLEVVEEKECELEDSSVNRSFSEIISSFL